VKCHARDRIADIQVALDLGTAEGPLHIKRMKVLILGKYGKIWRDEILQPSDSLCSNRIGHITIITCKPILEVELRIHPTPAGTEIRIQAALGEVCSPHQGQTPDDVEHHTSDP